MDGVASDAANAGSSSSSSSIPATAAAASSSSPNSTELMIALSHIQQLIPLLDYRPGGLTHLLPTLLTPLLPVQDAVPGESMQRYRANVDHAFRVAAELVARVQDAASVGGALELAETLMAQADEKARLLRVRKKRRLFVEQEKVLEVNSWGPPVSPRPAAVVKPAASEQSSTAKLEVELSAFLPSQNPPNTLLTTAQQTLPPPTTPQALQGYLSALHSYLQTAVAKGLFPPTVQLKHVKARIVAFSPEGFTLEVQVAQLVKALIDASVAYAPRSAEAAEAEEEAELTSVELAALTLGGVSESITSTTPSAFPIFRSLSTDMLAQTHRAVPPSRPANTATSVWTAYMPITETVARLILAAAQFQA
ncbi:uncharacterized protein SRS1_14136 [Sporisorium reilianum f. sp. reilianum]|uniref:Uncharacterized protein n=1 Tax=Sporisorium reilianum f. sp. reilianum TaxID=72559 RepID=A0A2N8UEA1_9BASI|nr:uncharacterized protein SRS1_14136 [Sporisorium reilianum f. sp. reilianum]